MPTVAVVDGVKIQFYANEHPPPHFHAEIAEYQAVVDIEMLSVVAGFLPPAKQRTIIHWATSRRRQLVAAFAQATSHDKVDPIE